MFTDVSIWIFLALRSLQSDCVDDLLQQLRFSFCFSMFFFVCHVPFSRKPRKGKGQKRKRKKNREKKRDLYVTSAFASSHLHLSVALLVVKLIWEEILCLL